MDPALMFLLHDSLSSNIEYLRNELVRQVSETRAAQAELQKVRSKYSRAQDKIDILNRIRKDANSITDGMKKELENNYAGKLEQQTQESKQLLSQMELDLEILKTEVAMFKNDNALLKRHNSALQEQVIQLHSTLSLEETQRGNLLLYIEDVLKANNLTLSSPQQTAYNSSLSVSGYIPNPPVDSTSLDVLLSQLSPISVLTATEDTRMNEDSEEAIVANEIVDSMELMFSNYKRTSKNSSSTPSTDYDKENVSPESYTNLYSNKTEMEKKLSDGRYPLKEMNEATDSVDSFFKEFVFLDSEKVDNVYDIKIKQKTSVLRSTIINSNTGFPQGVAAKVDRVANKMKPTEISPRKSRGLGFFRNPFRRDMR